ncbi:MAG: MFS transporter [candidate division WOR-3 bacterium]
MAQIPSILNFLYSASWITASIFIPLIAYRYTSDLFLVSLISGLYNGTLFFSSYIFGRFGDIYGRRKIIILGFLFSSIILIFHIFIKDIPSIFLLRGLAGFGFGIIPGALSALASGKTLGIFTGLGSLGFTIGNFLPGIIKNDFPVFLCASGFCIIGFFLSFSIKEEKRRITVPLFPVRVLLRNMRVYLPFFLRHTAAQGIWAIFPIYLTRLGADRFHIGLLYGINPLFQFIFMVYMDRFNSSSLITLGLFSSAVTFLGYAISANWQMILFFQILLGFSWGSLYLGALKYLLSNNVEQATVSGILNSVIGLSGITGPLIGGIIAQNGLPSLLYFSTILAFIAFLLFYLLKKIIV